VKETLWQAKLLALTNDLVIATLWPWIQCRLNTELSKQLNHLNLSFSSATSHYCNPSLSVCSP